MPLDNTFDNRTKYVIRRILYFLVMQSHVQPTNFTVFLL